MIPRRIVFWQNMLSPHQSSTISALAQNHGFEVDWVVASVQGRSDLTVGWNVPKVAGVNVVVSPDNEQIDEMLKKDPHLTLHLISGFRDHPFAFKLIMGRFKHGYRLGVTSEGCDPRGILGVSRKLYYTVLGVLLRNAIDCIFAMGSSGVEWYKNARWPKEKVFPFCYVVANGSDLETTENVGKQKGVYFIYVGQLTKRKGLDIALEGLAKARMEPPWKLLVVGAGGEEANLRLLAKRLNVERCVEFRGACKNPEARGLMARADFLILPSRYDGWGAVVNEALSVGTAVICTQTCGAFVLAGAASNGYVLQENSVRKWADCFANISIEGANRKERQQRAQWMLKISGDAVANYMFSVLRHIYLNEKRPNPPWM